MTLRIPPLQIARGPLADIPQFVWGEPALAYIPITGGSFETLWVGGYDNANHLVGGGLQTCQGEPEFSPPAGQCIQVYDTLNNYLWIYNQGWNAFCPCIANLPSTSSSGSTGGGGTITTTCCKGYSIPATLYLTITNCCTAFNGSYELTYQQAPNYGGVSGMGWLSDVTKVNSYSCNDIQWFLQCSGNYWILYMINKTGLLAQWDQGSGVLLPGENSCSPFEAAWQGGYQSDTNSFCGCSNTDIDITITS